MIFLGVSDDFPKKNSPKNASEIDFWVTSHNDTCVDGSNFSRIRSKMAEWRPFWMTKSHFLIHLTGSFRNHVSYKADRTTRTTTGPKIVSFGWKMAEWQPSLFWQKIIFTKKLGGQPMLIFWYNFKDQVRFLEILIFNIQGETFRSIFLPKVEQICIEMH